MITQHAVRRCRTCRFLLTAIGAVVVIIAAAALLAGCARPPHITTSPTGSASASTEPSWAPSSPAIPGDVDIAWAHLDTVGGTHTTGGDTDLHNLDQLTVPGTVADYLNTTGERSQSTSPNDVARLYAALAGNQDAAAGITGQAGGADQVFTRITDVCQLEHTRTAPVRGTALDIARYAACLREGGIAPPARSEWVIDQMRVTAGGIGDVRGNDGGQRLAQFHSTTLDVDRYHTGCMAIGAWWTAAILVEFPAERGELYGIDVCAQVADAEFPPDTQKAPEESPAPADTATA